MGDQQPNVMEDIQRTWEVFFSFYLFHKLVWYAGFSRHSNGRRKLMNACLEARKISCSK